jgi:hypothetical protein
MSMALRSRMLFTTRRARTVSFGLTVAAAAVAAALLSNAAPTGLGTADPAWSALLVGVLAFFGATARRWTWFLPAGVAAFIAGDTLATLLAAVAIAIAFVSVVRDTRSRARGAAVVGLGTIALLRAEPIGFHGLTAIVLVAVAVPLLVSGYAHAGRRVQRRTRRVAAVTGTALGLVLAGAALGVISVREDLSQGAHAIDGGLAAARQADDDTAAAQLSQAARSLTAADSTLSSWFAAPAKTLPVLGPNLSAVGELARQSSDVAELSSQAATDADVDTLRFVDGRLDPRAVHKMVSPLRRVRNALVDLDASVDRVGSPWLLAPVTNIIDRLDDQIADAIPDSNKAILAVQLGPPLLGEGGSQRYLVLFTTPVEARGRTGFPGNFAELLVTDGKLSMPRFGRISELERGGVPGDQRKLTQPADFMARYSRFDITTTWRNMTMSADFPSLAGAAMELYPQSGGVPVDGVISVDPQGLAALMRYTGPVQVDGLDQPLTTDNAAQFLMFDQYRLFTDVSQRTDVLEEVARTTFRRLTSASLPGPRALGDQLDPIVDGGHIQFVTKDDTNALQLVPLGVTGALPRPDPARDLVTVTTANAAGNKLDLFLHRSERYEAHWNPDTGEVTSTLQVTLDNTAPATGLPDYVAGNAVGLPRGSNRSFVSVYTPFDLDEARLGGRKVAVQSETELGHHVYSLFVDIPPGQKVVFELDLSGTRKGRQYRLDMPVQPFATPDKAEIQVTVDGGHGSVAASREATVDGGTVRWSTTLDRDRALVVSRP